MISAELWLCYYDIEHNLSSSWCFNFESPKGFYFTVFYVFVYVYQRVSDTVMLINLYLTH